MSDIRLTSARKAVLDLLEDSGRHLSAADIHAQLTDRLPSLNLSTVYRTMDYLVEHHLVSVADIGAGSPVYERLSESPHHHLVCLKCGHILEVAHAAVEPFFQELETRQDFAIRTNHLVLYGLCGYCQKQASDEE